MEDPKRLEGHQEWPPLVSVNHENVVEGHFDPSEFGWRDQAKEEVRRKYEEGC